MGVISWVRTKLSVFFSRVILPYFLEPLLVYYLKFWGPRSVQNHWRKTFVPNGKAHFNDDDAESDKTSPTQGSRSYTFEIQLATLNQHGPHVAAISAMVNGAYVRELRDALTDCDADGEAAFSRTSPQDIQRRLLSDTELKDLRNNTALVNRVLFLAVAKEDGAVIGTCAATLSAPWCPAGVGSWGLLAVATPRGGVGRRLVEHCEQYIKLAMLDKASIEYFCIEGHPSSTRLREWYETRLGYKCFKAKETGQSYRGNEVKGQVFFRHADKTLDITADLRSEAGSQEKVFQARKERLAKFLLAGTKSD